MSMVGPVNSSFFRSAYDVRRPSGDITRAPEFVRRNFLIYPTRRDDVFVFRRLAVTERDVYRLVQDLGLAAFSHAEMALVVWAAPDIFSFGDGDAPPYYVPRGGYAMVLHCLPCVAQTYCGGLPSARVVGLTFVATEEAATEADYHNFEVWQASRTG